MVFNLFRASAALQNSSPSKKPHLRRRPPSARDMFPSDPRYPNEHARTPSDDSEREQGDPRYSLYRYQTKLDDGLHISIDATRPIEGVRKVSDYTRNAPSMCHIDMSAMEFTKPPSSLHAPCLLMMDANIPQHEHMHSQGSPDGADGMRPSDGGAGRSQPSDGDAEESQSSEGSASKSEKAPSPLANDPALHPASADQPNHENDLNHASDPNVGNVDRRIERNIENIGRGTLNAQPERPDGWRPRTATRADPRARPAPDAAPSAPAPVAPAPVASAPARVEESAPWDRFQYGSREDMEMYDEAYPPGYVHTNMWRTRQRGGAPQAPTMLEYVRRLEARLSSLEARPRARGESQLHPDLPVRPTGPSNARVGFSSGFANQQPPGLDQTHELTPPTGNGSSLASQNSQLKVPPPKEWSPSKESEPLKVFLSRLKRYLQYHNLSDAEMALRSSQFLGGRAYELWEYELKHLENSHAALSWDSFEDFMLKTFGEIAPDRQARNRFENLRQTHTPMRYVQDMKRLILEIDGTSFAASPLEIISRFLQNAKTDLKNHLLLQAPDEFYTDPEVLFKRAVTYGMNAKAVSQAQAPPKVVLANVETQDAPVGNPKNPGSDGAKRKRSRRRGGRRKGQATPTPTPTEVCLNTDLPAGKRGSGQKRGRGANGGPQGEPPAKRPSTGQSRHQPEVHLPMHVIMQREQANPPQCGYCTSLAHTRTQCTSERVMPLAHERVGPGYFH